VANNRCTDGTEYKSFRIRNDAKVGIKTCPYASQFQPILWEEESKRVQMHLSNCHSEILMMQRWTSKLVIMPLEVGKER
jgi:hypothetical protein